MRSMRPSHLVSGLATAALIVALGFWSAAGAAEFHFVVQNVGEKRALWIPQEVVIHRSTEMQEGLVFILENPPGRTQAFAAYTKSLDALDLMLARMMGATADGLHDRLMEFSRAVTGATFFVPSLETLSFLKQ